MLVVSGTIPDGTGEAREVSLQNDSDHAGNGNSHLLATAGS